MKKSTGLKLLLVINFAFLLASEKETISEMVGYLIKEEIDKCHYDIDVTKVIEGLQKAAKGKKAPLSKEQYQQLISKVIEQSLAEKEKANLQLASDFLQKNKLNKGVIELVEKKLQYECTSVGKGEAVNQYHTPVINIKGALPDNTIFLSEREYIVDLNNLPQGLKLAILGMKENEKRKIYIHPDYAQKLFGFVTPRSLLIYEIELLNSDKSKLNSINNNLVDNSGTVR
jgi:peptidylprolyl isomerase